MEKITIESLFHNECYTKYLVLLSILADRETHRQRELCLLCSKNTRVKRKTDDPSPLEEKWQLNNDARVNEHLQELRRLHLITYAKRKHGYYLITDFGFIEYLKYYVHYLLDNTFPDDPDEAHVLTLEITGLVQKKASKYLLPEIRLK